MLRTTIGENTLAGQASAELPSSHTSHPRPPQEIVGPIILPPAPGPTFNTTSKDLDWVSHHLDTALKGPLASDNMWNLLCNMG